MTTETRILSAVDRMMKVGVLQYLPAVENCFPKQTQGREYFTDVLCFHDARKYHPEAPMTDYTNFPSEIAEARFVIQLEECARQAEIVPPVRPVVAVPFAVGGGV